MTRESRSTTGRPTISVIVPFLQSERHIRVCIESLLGQADVEGRAEIILVNNGSTDRSASIAAEYAEVTVLTETTPGAYAARNAGIRHASAPLIAFTDSDCVVDRTWIRAMQEEMRDASTAALVGHCRYPDRASIALRLLGAYENAKAEYVITRGAPTQRFAYANNMAVRASVFEELGVFREWTRAADSEFIHRLGSARTDLRFRYSHSVRVTHLEFINARERVRRLALYTRTNAQITTFRELSIPDRLGILAQLVRQALQR